MEEVVSLINNQGFPIAVCLIMFFFFKYMFDTNKKEIKEINDKYQANLDKMQEALNNNTIAITKLCEKLDNYIERGETDNA